MGIIGEQGLVLGRFFSIYLHRDKDKNTGDQWNDQSFYPLSQVLSGAPSAKGEPGACTRYEEKERHPPVMQEDHHVAQCPVKGPVIFNMPVPGVEDHADVKKKYAQDKNDPQPVDIILTFVPVSGFCFHEDLFLIVETNLWNGQRV